MRRKSLVEMSERFGGEKWHYGEKNHYNINYSNIYDQKVRGKKAFNEYLNDYNTYGNNYAYNHPYTNRGHNTDNNNSYQEGVDSLNFRHAMNNNSRREKKNISYGRNAYNSDYNANIHKKSTNFNDMYNINVVKKFKYSVNLLPKAFYTSSNRPLQYHILSKIYQGNIPYIFFQFSPLVLIVGFIYTKRHSRSTKPYQKFTNFFLTGCSLAQKIWNDKIMDINSFLHREERKILECWFCKNVDYDFMINEKEFGWWLVMLCN